MKIVSRIRVPAWLSSSGAISRAVIGSSGRRGRGHPITWWLEAEETAGYCTPSSSPSRLLAHDPIALSKGDQMWRRRAARPAAARRLLRFAGSTRIRWLIRRDLRASRGNQCADDDPGPCHGGTATLLDLHYLHGGPIIAHPTQAHDVASTRPGV